MAGVTATGFLRKQLTDIVTGLQNRMVAVLQPLQPTGDPVDVSPQSVIGQQIGVFAQDLSDLWELAENVFNSHFVDTAEGACLEQAYQLVGVDRLGASLSTIIESVSGNEGVTVDTAFQVRNTSGVFQADNPVTITAAAADRVRVSVLGATIGQMFTATINGTPITVTAVAPTASSVAVLLVAAITSGTPVATAALSADVSAGDTFDILAVGAPIAVAVGTGLVIADRAAQVPMTATSPGPIDVSANTVKTIVTPRFGITAVTNRVDGVAGVLIETDADLKAKGRQRTRGIGSASAEAIRGKLPRIVPGIYNVDVYENDTDSVDGDSRPAHSFETVVVGGADLAIGRAIWSMKGLGVKTFGNTSVVIADAAGNPQTVNFSRPTNVYIWVAVVIGTFDTTTAYPSDGDQQIKNAIATMGNLIRAGGLIAVQAFNRAVYSVPGIAAVTITVATSSTAAGPPGAYGGSNISLSIEQKALFDPSRVSVTP